MRPKNNKELMIKSLSETVRTLAYKYEGKEGYALLPPFQLFEGAADGFIALTDVSVISVNGRLVNSLTDISEGERRMIPINEIEISSGYILLINPKGNYDNTALLLNNYPATAAYSLRQLDRGYSGSAIRVRRDSDNAEQDIGFTESGDLDIAALELFMGVSSETLPADYSSGAFMAFSLRHVSDSYSGVVVRVRRSSDNAEQDFTPTEIEDGTLEAWVGAGNNGYVVKLHPQVGSIAAFQPIASDQPIIVSLGTLYRDGGLPAIYFDGINYHLDITASPLNDMSVFIRFKAFTGQDSVIFELSPFANDFLALGLGDLGVSDAYGVRYRIGGVDTSVGTTGVTGSRTMSIFGNSSVPDVTGYIDGVEMLGAQSARARNNGTSAIGARGEGLFPTECFIQEFIVYNTNVVANRTEIEANIDSYYAASGTNGFITTWYDQMGNGYHAEQGTALEQPKIYDSSTGLYLQNGEPSILFDGTSTFFEIAKDITGEDFAVYAVIKPIAQDPAQDGWIFDNLTSYGRGLLHDDYFSGRMTLITDTTSTTPIRVRSSISPDLTLITGLIDNNTPSGGTVEIFRNGAVEDSFSGNVPYEENTFVQYIGAGSGSPNEVYNGYMMELIVYTANDFTTSGSPNQTSIESNINSHYNIYS